MILGESFMYVYLDIVKDFQCQMCGVCCRREWLVTVDEASYHRNKKLFSAQGKAAEFEKAFIPLEKQTTPGEFAFITKKAWGGCWFLTEDNCCRLHRDAGHEHLDTVCQTFPRYPMDTSRGMEVTLSFSCPAVMEKVRRIDPLTIIRSSEPPTAFNEEASVVSVYPKQRHKFDVFRYYFELEHHCIDILQWRGAGIAERLRLLEETIGAVAAVCKQSLCSQDMKAVFYRNYEMMDKLPAGKEKEELCTPEILAEHFLVNLLFKKVLYLYGQKRTMQLFWDSWQSIEESCRNKEREEALLAAAQVIMDIELQYGHNRQALFK